jgi:DNA-binding NarL/FixJ family response regulator
LEIMQPAVNSVAAPANRELTGAPTGSIRVLLADDHTGFRNCLRELLEMEEDIVIVGEAGDGIEAERQAAALRPDVVVMDVQMPGQNGLHTTRALSHFGHSPRVIILTIYKHASIWREAACAGAYGCFVKGISTDRLLEAIRTVAAGQSLIAPVLNGCPSSVSSNQGSRQLAG